MHRIALLACCACLGAPFAGAQAKFERQKLVDDAASACIGLSPRGVRVAAVVPKGSRERVVVDGVEGPVFEEVVNLNASAFTGRGGSALPAGQVQAPIGRTPNNILRVLFSADGKRFAYVGRNGSEFAVMLDGAELSRGTYHNLHSIAFSPEGAHLMVTFRNLENTQMRVEVDGKAGPWAATINESVFSADGAHYAYDGQQPDATLAPWSVVDGRQVKHLGQLVGFTPTGALLSRLAVPEAGELLLANGKQIAHAQSFGYLAFAPVGDRLIVAATPLLGRPPVAKPAVLTVDGKVVEGTENVNVLGSWFSPDGKRWAVLCQRFTPRMESFMIVDGKREPSYQNISGAAPHPPSFSPDSSKFLYLAQASNGQTFVVVNGEESDGVQAIATAPTWSPTGSRLAWGGTVQGKAMFWLDGKEVALPRGAQPGSTFLFSPNGARTFWSCGPAHDLSLIVDGVALPEVSGLAFAGAEAIDGNSAALRFSPDGRHYAYMARDPKQPTRQGMWVDGKLITEFTQPQGNRVTFTPDSRHVYWAVMGVRDGASVYRVFADGIEVLAYTTSMLDTTRAAWEMGADGTLTLLGLSGGSLERYRIPPPADTSIESMLAKG